MSARKTKAQQLEYDNQLANLREWIKPGDTVYTILDHVSSSGMSRAIRVVIPTVESIERYVDTGIGGYTETMNRVDFLHPNYAVGEVLGLRHWKRNGNEQDALILSGAGMDMGFHLVYSLGRVLWPDGFPCVGKGCRSNDHSNGDRDYTSGHVVHRDGGYALNHRWL